MNKEGYSVAVAGATGAVGREMIKILEQRCFPVDKIRFLASSRSAGSFIEFCNQDVKVELLERDSFEGMDIALFSAGGSISEEYAPFAAQSGCIVVDNSSAFRMDPDVPLVVPEINPHAIGQFNNRGIIANPNCSTIQMVMALKPIHDVARIKRVVVSTYQAVSGTGKKGIDELKDQVKDILSFQSIECNAYPHQIAFNCLPQIDVFLENGYTKEEIKMVNETKKILEDDSIRITATTVRVPVFYGHSESVNIETQKKISVLQVRELLSQAQGIVVVDDPASSMYPLPIRAAGKDDTFVGRIREDESIENGINMWIVSDNLRKGAALNAVQIAEVLIRDFT
ncbi:MAG: aspartate-semialdehyde dehydrogenase [Thermodesulfobacteriota bacterium]|nr:aspartate-semialdehyde dehydrogenase [Thermodesulfobacteriota bacterium]